MKKKFLILLLLFIGAVSFSSEFIYDNEGFPVQRIENTQNGKVISNFVFKDKELVFTSKFYEDEENPFEIEYYLKNPIDKSLIGVKRFSGTNLVGDNYLYSEETLFLNASDNLVFTTDFEISNDGEITITQEDGSVETYSSDGLLTKKNQENTYEEFFYDENRNLVFSYSSSSDLPDSFIKKEYKEGKVYTETVYDKGLIDHVTVFETIGKNITIYENGNPIALVKYYQDNKRVREVLYL